MYSYKVKYVNLLEREETVTGIVSGQSYKECIAELVNYYGDSELLEVKISFINDLNVLKMPEGFMEIIEEENPNF